MIVLSQKHTFAVLLYSFFLNLKNWITIFEGKSENIIFTPVIIEKIRKPYIVVFMHIYKPNLMLKLLNNTR